MKASKQMQLPPPMTDAHLVHRIVQHLVRRHAGHGWTYWGNLIPTIGFAFGVGVLDSNHIARRHLALCWRVAL